MLVFVLFAVAVVALLTEIWLFRTWSSLSVDEVFYHLSVSLEGTNSDMIVAYAVNYGIPILVILALAALVLFLLRKRTAAYRAWLGILLVAAIGSIGWALVDMDHRMGLFSYVADSLSGTEAGDFVDEHYIDPAAVQVDFPEKKRNLIYIFAESMEMTFADKANGGAFERNAIPELTQLAQANEDFGGNDTALDGAIPLPGTEWTMGAMFAHTSGLPLKLALGGNAFENADAFFPSITTLGDILEAQGYNQTLMIGSPGVFGGRSLYFTDHGNYRILDYNYALENGIIPPSYKVFWGFEDEKLFGWAKQELTSLAASQEPFNLTLLTVDTHFEDGYVCRLCGSEFGDDQYANVFACSSRQISEFVEWIQAQDFYANTTIIVCGDHTTMDTDFCANVPGDYLRKCYTCVINGAAQALPDAARRTYSTFDMFPTTLAALGAQIPGDKLGMGVNLYAQEPTLVEDLGVDACTRELRRPSEFLDNRAGIGIDESTMRKVAGMASLEAEPQMGGMHFVLSDCYELNGDSIKRARLAITDTRTGEEASFEMKVVRPPNDPNWYTIQGDAPYSEDDLPHLQVKALLTVPGFEDYEVAELEH